MRVLLILISAIALLTSCATVTAKKITLTQFESGEVLVGTVNTLSREITITMPNGATLKGKYTPLHANPGETYALLKDDNSNLMLEIRATVSGVSGFGSAQSNHGVKYRVQF